MKVKFVCFACHHESRLTFVWVELDDTGLHELECEQGHRTIHILEHPKWETLFEMALIALSDGYTREAVATLAASIEEFYRAFTKAMLRRRDVSDSAAENFWKLLDRAEPQFGAFVTTYLLEKGHAPPFPDRKSTEFRNAVIHRGKIPKLEEVMEYGEKIVAFLVPLYKEQSIAGDVAGATRAERQRSLRKRGEDEHPGGTVHVTAFSHIVYWDVPRTFSEALRFAREKSFLRTHGVAG